MHATCTLKKNPNMLYGVNKVWIRLACRIFWVWRRNRLAVKIALISETAVFENAH